MSEIVPDHVHPDAFVVRTGVTEQSWVDLRDPLRLEFEYTQRIAEVLGATVLARDGSERVRVVHLGGGGLSLPRFVAARRPHTAQIVLEPDAELVAQVRARLPLPPGSGIKIRETDGRAGLAAMPADYADAIIVDAFTGSQVPGDLATIEFFADTARVLRDRGVVTMNLGDRAPFAWARRCIAALAASYRYAAVSAEVPVWKGRRYGNLVVAAAPRPLPLVHLERKLAGAAFPYRLLSAGALDDWIGGVPAFTDATAESSPDAVARGWLR